jgi:hypothetical protein
MHGCRRSLGYTHSSSIEEIAVTRDGRQLHLPADDNWIAPSWEARWVGRAPALHGMERQAACGP